MRIGEYFQGLGIGITWEIKRVRDNLAIFPAPSTSTAERSLKNVHFVQRSESFDGRGEGDKKKSILHS